MYKNYHRKGSLFKLADENERVFLDLAYNKLESIIDEVFSETTPFWDNNPYYRFSKIKDAFALYSEILNYKFFKVFFEIIKGKYDLDIVGNEVFRFIRNIIIHFPLFDQWDDVWISKALVNWYKEGLTIDKFLKKYVGKERMGFAYKYSDEDESFPTMVSINFPPKYDNKSKLYLKDFIKEKEGIEFSLIVMKSGIIEGQDFVFKVLSKTVRKDEEDIK